MYEYVADKEEITECWNGEWRGKKGKVTSSFPISEEVIQNVWQMQN